MERQVKETHTMLLLMMMVVEVSIGERFNLSEVGRVSPMRTTFVRPARHTGRSLSSVPLPADFGDDLTRKTKNQSKVKV